jgi:pimeloyl-ACP methyl ester carboxylesterase
MGDSAKPLAGYDAATLADDLEGLLDVLGVGRAHLVGHDLGGPVAYAFAATRRARTASLALVEAPLHGVTGERVPDLSRAYWHMMFQAQVDVAHALISGREDVYLEWFFRTFAHDKTAIAAEDAADYVRCLRMPGGLRGSLMHYHAIAETAAQFRRHAETPLETPVLGLGSALVLGDYVVEACRLVARDVTGGVIPDCGHWVAEERPHELARLLVDFWEGGAREHES